MILYLPDILVAMKIYKELDGVGPLITDPPPISCTPCNCDM